MSTSQPQHAFIPALPRALTLAGVTALLLCPLRAPAGTIQGVARVVDGDTLVIGGTRIRLAEIDAPELKQRCGEMECGRVAKKQLEHLVDGRRVECTPRAQDKYGRTVAKCMSRGMDLGERMVEDGFAVVDGRFGKSYEAVERKAKEQRR